MNSFDYAHAPPRTTMMLCSTRASLRFFPSSQSFAPLSGLIFAFDSFVNRIPHTPYHRRHPPDTPLPVTHTFILIHLHLHLYLSSSSIDNMSRPPETVCANWSPGQAGCKKPTRIVCSKCQLVEVSPSGNIVLYSGALLLINT